MPIPYQLLPNRLTADPRDHYARVRSVGSLGLNALIKRVAKRGTTVTEADTRAVLVQLIDELKDALADGYRVNLGDVASLHPSITGKFDGPRDVFDRSRHALQLNATASKATLAFLRENATFEKLENLDAVPALQELRDGHSATINERLSPGHMATIAGKRLRFNPAKADEGLFLIPAGDNAGDPALRVTEIQTLKPSELVFLVPALLDGLYKVEVRARLNGGQTLRTGTLAEPVEVMSVA